LRLIVDQVPTANATYVVRPDLVEIMTNEYSLPVMQFVEGNFQDVPLEEVLADLSDRTGTTILIDSRVGEKAKSLVSANLRTETNLATAVRLLADMADLKAVIVDRVIYITLRTNMTDFPPGRLPGHKTRIDGA